MFSPAFERRKVGQSFQMDYRQVNVSEIPQFNAGVKMAWAKKHLDRLQVKIAKFLEGQTHIISFEDDFEAGEYIIRIDPDPLPIDLGLIAGDYLCCLRASLDHLVYALTLTRKGTANVKASFPIIPVNNTNGRNLFIQSLKGVPGDAVKIIDLLQPYHHGKGYKLTKLWKLHRLWNIDKHRRIPIYATGARLSVTFPPDMPPINSGPDNSGVLRFPLAAKPSVYLDPVVEIGIWLGDVTEDIVVPAQELIEIYNFVRYEVAPRFSDFFTGPEKIGQSK